MMTNEQLKSRTNQGFTILRPQKNSTEKCFMIAYFTESGGWKYRIPKTKFPTKELCLNEIKLMSRKDSKLLLNS
jgi:hypothetical protein